MTCDTDGTRCHLKRRRDVGRFLLCIEREDEQRPIARRQRIQTILNARLIEHWLPRRDGDRAIRERLGQSLAPVMGAAQIRRDRPARAQDERSNRLHVADPTAAQPLDQDDENLLDKVLRSGCVTQVPEAIEPDPRCETPIKLRLLFLRGPWRGGRNCVGEHCIGGGG